MTTFLFNSVNPDDIKRLFPNASRSLFAANAPHPELFSDGPIDGQKTTDAVRRELEPSPRAGTLGTSKAKKADSRRFFVRVTSRRRILLDEDNLCEKFAIDCCRYAGLLPGDGPGQTQIEVCQEKVRKGEPEETVVEIYQLP